LTPWGVFLCKVDLALGAELGTPQTNAPLQSAQHAVVPMPGVTALQFFKQSDSVQMNVALEQRNNFAVPN
jgi:hypothetical protein